MVLHRPFEPAAQTGQVDSEVEVCKSRAILTSNRSASNR